MSKTMDAIRSLAWVSAVDDEREDGSSIIVTLKAQYEFCGEDPGCGVKGFDTVALARAGTRRGEVQLSAAAPRTSGKLNGPGVEHLMTVASYRCFACDRVIRRTTPLLADTRDDQVVHVGPECLRKVEAAGDSGYQPPLGGPRLYPVAALSQEMQPRIGRAD